MDEKFADMSIVTEIGTFGSLNIDDPTVKKVKDKKDMTEEEIDALIKESIQHNANI